MYCAGLYRRYRLFAVGDKMYKCETCGTVFVTPDYRLEDTGGYETGVGYYPYYEAFPCCPECESEDFDEMECYAGEED